MFELLCHALRLKDGPLEKRVIDWNAVYREAQNQAVVGVAFDGMQQMVECRSSAIEKPLLLQWYAEVMTIERQNAVVNGRMAEVVALLRQAGIPFVVMKGQTVAARYPNPMRRQSGDIDVFVWGGQYEAACELLVQNGGVADEVAPEKHTEFKYHEVVVEIHHTLLDLCSPYAMKYLQGLDYGALVEERQVAGRDVPCFLDAFNSVYLLGHMVHHLLTEGLGLRQVCDWMVLMKQCEPIIYNNVSELKRHLDGMQLQAAFSAFAMMGTKHFGLNAECWQWALMKNAEPTADTLVTFILESGNFGRKTNEKKSSKTLQGNLSNAWLYFRHLVKLRHIAPAEVRWFFFTRTKRWWKKRKMTG
ncbi:MAG: nucleotidyltransferase family protein [Bacteroidaceae bacterium]|nr:nucleotidyltransferase family protein [Bacteroidaceae bacterium]